MSEIKVPCDPQVQEFYRVRYEEYVEEYKKLQAKHERLRETLHAIQVVASWNNPVGNILQVVSDALDEDKEERQ